AGAGADHRRVGHTVGEEVRAGAHLGVHQDDAVLDARAVTDLGAPAQGDPPTELDVDADLDARLDVGGGRIAKGDVRHQGAVGPRAQDRFRLGQLLAVVD